jgi:transglutaminase-like putative cysteine protease
VTQGDNRWGRNPSTDLPQLSVVVSYSVRNEGTTSAENTHIVVLLDNNVAKDYLVIIASRDHHSSSVTFVFLYDTAHKVSVDASCSGSSDQASLAIDAHLNRNPTLEPDIAKLYITPNDPVVRATLNVIAKSPFYSVSKWTTIRDWVSLNIGYEGTGNYWQLPRETLQRKAGVCKEYSTLLVSLLRAAGYSEDRVFVVLGRKGEATSGHAWVRIRVDVIGWQSIEPQAPSLMTFIGDRLVLSDYRAIYYFNDVSYVSLS